MANCVNCGRPLASFTFGEASNLCPECRAARSVAPPAPPAAVVRPRRPMTIALVATNAAVFVAMGVSGASWLEPNTRDLLRWGADFGPLTLSTQPWRALTSNYVHIGIVHILFNMWCLWDLGQLSERIFGRWTYFLVYTFSGLAGSLASLWWRPMAVGAGASGAIFGLAGALIVALYLGDLPFPKQAMQRTLRSLLMFAGYNLFFGAVAAHVDNSAHVGGLVGGAVLGACLAGSLTKEAEARVRARQLVFGGAVVVLVAAAAFVNRSSHYAVVLNHAQEALTHAHPKAALPDLQQLVKDRPNDPEGFALLGNAYLQQKNYAQAEATLHRALELDPESENAQYSMGLVYLQTSRYQPALDTFTNLQQQDAKEPEIVVLKGDALRGLKRYDPAMDAYHQALTLDPKSAGAYLGIGETQFALGHVDDALASLQKAAALDADDSEIQQALAKAYAAKGMTQESQAAAQKADALEKADSSQQ